MALVIDLRGREFFTALSESLAYIKDESTIGCEILFLDATDSVLVQRYKESRRHHPLAPKGMPLDGIRMERQMLEEPEEFSYPVSGYQQHEAGSGSKKK